MTCKICYEDLDDLIKYNTSKDELSTLYYCIDCLKYMLVNMGYDYIKKIKTADCEKSLKNLINEGIPVYFRDNQVNNNLEIKQFYYNDKIINGILNNYLSIDEIIILNNKLKNAMLNSDYLTLIENIL